MSHDNPQQAKVIIRSCEEYDAEAIQAIIQEGLQELKLTPSGRVLAKPNMVAAGPQFEHAFTRAEFVEGVLRALREEGGEDIEELAVGERCGITIPTRYVFSEAHYNPMLKRVGGVKRYLFDEVTQVEIPYTHEGRLRDYVFTPEPIARADFFVNMPKFKTHPWTTVTFSLKNYIGIQDDRHRLIDHDHRLDEKIADLQYIIQPQFIAIDAIIAGQGRMLTPQPIDLKLILMGNNQVAFDSVCCHILGLDPLSVDHIRLASERGFGPTGLEDIQVSGDVTLEAARDRAVQLNYEAGLIRVEKYFEGTHITAYAGPPPEPERTDYCWGGCPGAIEEAIEIIRQFDDQCDENIARLHVVFGAYQGPIPAEEGEKVIFIGDCARWQGTLWGDREVEVESTYKARGAKDPYTIKHQGMYAKLFEVMGRVRRAKKDPHVRLEGCPVSVSEQMLALCKVGGVKNPIFDPGEGVKYNKAYSAWKIARAWRAMTGRSYQRAGTCERGLAAPGVDGDIKEKKEE